MRKPGDPRRNRWTGPAPTRKPDRTAGHAALPRVTRRRSIRTARRLCRYEWGNCRRPASTLIRNGYLRSARPGAGRHACVPDRIARNSRVCVALEHACLPGDHARNCGRHRESIPGDTYRPRAGTGGVARAGCARGSAAAWRAAGVGARRRRRRAPPVGPEWGTQPHERKATSRPDQKHSGLTVCFSGRTLDG
jgi:hypothetical protein